MVRVRVALAMMDFGCNDYSRLSGYHTPIGAQTVWLCDLCQGNCLALTASPGAHERTKPSHNEVGFPAPSSALHPSGVASSSTSFGWGKGGNVTSAGWQVTLCDPIWLYGYLQPPSQGAGINGLGLRSALVPKQSARATVQTLTLSYLLLLVFHHPLTLSLSA